MIGYFDTSAVIPMFIEEPSSGSVIKIWESATQIVSVRLMYPEARAALAQAQRMGRLTGRQLRSAVEELNRLDNEIAHIEITAQLATRAGELAELAALRGYDAIHMAGAELVADDDLVFVTGDSSLSRASHALGIDTAFVG